MTYLIISAKDFIVHGVYPKLWRSSSDAIYKKNKNLS